MSGQCLCFVAQPTVRSRDNGDSPPAGGGGEPPPQTCPASSPWRAEVSRTVRPGLASGTDQTQQTCKHREILPWLWYSSFWWPYRYYLVLSSELQSVEIYLLSSVISPFLDFLNRFSAIYCWEILGPVCSCCTVDVGTGETQNRD